MIPTRNIKNYLRGFDLAMKPTVPNNRAEPPDVPGGICISVYHDGYMFKLHTHMKICRDDDIIELQFVANDMVELRAMVHGRKRVSLGICTCNMAPTEILMRIGEISVTDGCYHTMQVKENVCEIQYNENFYGPFEGRLEVKLLYRNKDAMDSDDMAVYNRCKEVLRQNVNMNGG